MTFWIGNLHKILDSPIPDITQEGHFIKFRKRQISVCRLGWIKIIAKLISHGELPFSMFIPESITEVSKRLAIQRSMSKTRKKTYP